MILNKIIAGLFLLFFLNGCVQSTAFFGPAYTLVSTGNVYHAGLSYGSGHAVKNVTGKTPTENIKNFINNKVEENEEKKNDAFLLLVKKNIKKISKILKTPSQ
jgi:hypothetical protein